MTEPMALHEDDLEMVATELFGGPLDGARYRIPIFPGHTKPGDRMSTPLGQPAPQHPFAVYDRIGDEPVGGVWEYGFVRIDPPEVASAEADEPDMITTCSGLAPQPHPDH